MYILESVNVFITISQDVLETIIFWHEASKKFDYLFQFYKSIEFNSKVHQRYMWFHFQCAWETKNLLR